MNSKLKQKYLHEELEVPEEVEEPGSNIPVIRPPISFPKLPENVQIPEYPEERG